MKHRFFVLVCIFVFGAMSAFAGMDSWVVLKMKGGMTQAYLVPGQMKVKVEKDSLRLSSPKMEVAYGLSKVEGYFFQKDNSMPTEIEEITRKGISVRYVGEDRVEISGITSGAAVKIYGTNGMEYNNCSESLGDVIVISLGSLPLGVYIINIEGIGSVKVFRR